MLPTDVEWTLIGDEVHELLWGDISFDKWCQCGGNDGDVCYDDDDGGDDDGDDDDDDDDYDDDDGDEYLHCCWWIAMNCCYAINPEENGNYSGLQIWICRDKCYDA